MPSTSLYDGLINAGGGGGGTQLASNSDDVVNTIIKEADAETCVELTAAEIAADMAGKDFAVLRQECASADREISEGWGQATPAEIAEYKSNVGMIPKITDARCLTRVVSLNDPMKDAKQPGACQK